MAAIGLITGQITERIIFVCIALVSQLCSQNSRMKYARQIVEHDTGASIYHIYIYRHLPN